MRYTVTTVDGNSYSIEASESFHEMDGLLYVGGCVFARSRWQSVIIDATPPPGEVVVTVGGRRVAQGDIA